MMRLAAKLPARSSLAGGRCLPIPNCIDKRAEMFFERLLDGGEPDGAVVLPALLSANGFIIRSAAPLIFCVRPNDYMWQWPATFIEVYLPRLIEMGRIDPKFADKLCADLASAEGNPNSLMITPLVLEIVAEKL